MEYTCFNLEIKKNIAHLQLNRPDEFNTMNRSFWKELPAILNEINDKASARVVVLSSTGKHFSAGLDLGLFADEGKKKQGELGRQREQLRTTILTLQEAFNTFERIRMPVLAAVHGGCIGGGIDMISACDIRYCSADAYFTIMEINVGMTADVGTLQRLPHIIPSGVVREMAYTGRKVFAEEAKEIGLVNKIFKNHDALIEGVIDIAMDIATHTPLAIYGTKEMLNYTRDHTIADSLNYIATWQTGMFQSQDIMESMIARAEKREPKYDDLLPKDRRW